MIYVSSYDSHDLSDFVYSEGTLLLCVYSYSLQNYTDISKLFFELPAPDMKKNYAFRLRMRLECTQKPWGEWSPVKYWRNDTGKDVSMFWQVWLLILDVLTKINLSYSDVIRCVKQITLCTVSMTLPFFILFKDPALQRPRHLLWKIIYW